MAVTRTLLALILILYTTGFLAICKSNFVLAYSSFCACFNGTDHFGVFVGSRKETSSVFYTSPKISRTLHSDTYRMSAVYLVSGNHTRPACTPLLTSCNRHLPLFRRRYTWLSMLLLLSGNVELNPGPRLALYTKSQPPIQSSLQLYQFLPTYFDGHCQLHAVSISIRNYLDVHISSEDIALYTRAELANHYNLYVPFVNVSHLQFSELLNRYFVYKTWNNSLCDILLLAIANTFSTYIVIVTPNNSDYSHFLATPSQRATPLPYICIHLFNSHYSSCTSALSH